MNLSLWAMGYLSLENSARILSTKLMDSGLLRRHGKDGKGYCFSGLV